MTTTLPLAPSRTMGPAFARFSAANLRHIKGPLTGKPFVFDPWQHDDYDLMLEVDERGLPVWREILYGIGRGMGKSPGVGALGLMELASRRDRPEVVVGSGARDQAKIVGEFTREMAKAGPLADWTRPTVNGVRWAKPGGGAIIVVSSDGGLQHGKSPAKAILDELHVFTTAKQDELYNAQQSSLHKRPDSQLIGITTAGWNPQTLLGELYATMLKAPFVERTGPMGCRLVCADRDAGRLMIWWGAPEDADIEDPELWKACNPASWIGPEQIARLAMTMPRAVFQRLHLNQWTSSAAVTIRPEAWAACQGEPGTPAGAVLVLSASPRRDAAALVAVWREGDRTACELVGEWDEMEQGALEDAAVDAAERFVSRARVDLFVADPIQLDSAYRRIVALGLAEYRGKKATRAGMAQTDAFMEPATGLLVSAIESGELLHDGGVVLRRHVLRAEAVDTRRGWRLARPKKAGERKVESVEGAMALAMGVYACSQHESNQPMVVDLWG